MRLLTRNTTYFEYLPYIGLESDVDEDNLHTGDYKPKYGSPVTYRGNISAPSGSAAQAFDGLEIRYSHVLLLDEPDAEIDETGKIRHNGKLYEIKSVIRSINVLSAALLADTVDHGDQEVYEPDDSGNQGNEEPGEGGEQGNEEPAGEEEQLTEEEQNG